MECKCEQKRVRIHPFQENQNQMKTKMEPRVVVPVLLTVTVDCRQAVMQPEILTASQTARQPKRRAGGEASMHARMHACMARRGESFFE